jgi:hypothetical protein
MVPRVCSKCSSMLSPSSFNQNNVRGFVCLRADCKRCCNQYWCEYTQKRKAGTLSPRKVPPLEERKLKKREREKRAKLRYCYNLSPQQYQLLLEAQQGVCAICHQPETWKNQFGLCQLSVDHDHVTGQVRRLLCRQCNHWLAILEDPSFGTAAMAYLETYGSGALGIAPRQESFFVARSHAL